MYVYIHDNTYMCMYVCIHDNTYKCMYVCIHDNTYKCMYVCIHDTANATVVAWPASERNTMAAGANAVVESPSLSVSIGGVTASLSLL